MNVFLATQNAWVPSLPDGVDGLWVMSGHGALWPGASGEPLDTWLGRSSAEIVEDVERYAESFPDVSSASEVVIDGEKPIAWKAIATVGRNTAQMQAWADAIAARVDAVRCVLGLDGVHVWGSVSPLAKGQWNDGYSLRTESVSWLRDLGAYDGACWHGVTLYPHTPDIEDSLSMIARGIEDGRTLFGSTGRLLPVLGARLRASDEPIDADFLAAQLASLVDVPRVLVWARPDDVEMAAELLTEALA